MLTVTVISAPPPAPNVLSNILIVSPGANPVPLLVMFTVVPPLPSTIILNVLPVPSELASGKPGTVYVP